MFTIGRLGLLLLASGTAVAACCAVTVWAATIRASTTLRPRHVAGVNRVGWIVLLAAAVGGWLSTSALGWAFAASDWRFAYITDHARPDLAWPLRIGGLWAGPEGSLLLWSTMVTTVGVIAAAADRSRRSPGDQQSTATIGHALAAIVAAGHSIITLGLANPFQRLDAPPAGGTGLQPVLEHPAMVWHPPLLYAGLVSLLIPAGLAVASAARGETVSVGVRRSMLWALAVLTVGLATGANWAYVELGWGGYWAWDPIENAGLIAWLVAASTVHRLSPDHNRGWPVIALAVTPAVAAVWATTITRTGVLSSVHSFANEPALRTALLVVAGAVTLLTISAVAITARLTATTAERPRSRSGALVLVVTAGLVAVGTYQPFVAKLLGGEDAITGPTFYALILWPIVAAGAVARVGAAASTVSPVSTIVAGVLGALLAMVVAGAAAGVLGLVVAASGGAIVGALVSKVFTGRSKARGSSIAHIGIGVLLVGVGGSLASTTDTVQVSLGVTTPVEANGAASEFDVLFEGVELVEGDGVRRAVASVVVDGRRLEPALVSFVRSGAGSVETATGRGWLADIQVSLVDAETDRAILRVSHQPRMTLVWLGTLLIAIGFGLSALQRGVRSSSDDASPPTSD